MHHKDSKPSPYQVQPSPEPYQKPIQYGNQVNPPYQQPVQYGNQVSPPYQQPTQYGNQVSPPYQQPVQYGNQVSPPYQQHIGYPIYNNQPNPQPGYPYQQTDYLNPNQIPIDKSSKSSIMKSVAKKIFYAAKSHHNGKKLSNHNYQSGMYNDYNYRPQQYSSIQGETCTNYLEYDGIVYGTFICPIEGFSYEAKYCCGPPREQYCCTLYEFKSEEKPFEKPYHDQYVARRFDKYFLFILVPVLIIFCILVGVCGLLIYKKKDTIYSLIRKRDNDDNTLESNEENLKSINDETEKEKLNEENPVEKNA